MIFAVISFLFPLIALTASSSDLQSQTLEIAKELRSPSSPTISVYESESPEALKIKAQIFQKLREGKNREEILKFFSQRYGNEIRFAPEMSGSTLILWLVPVLLGVVIFIWLLLALRSYKR